MNLSAEHNFFKATDAAALPHPLAITRTTIYTCTNFSVRNSHHQLVTS